MKILALHAASLLTAITFALTPIAHAEDVAEVISVTEPQAPVVTENGVIQPETRILLCYWIHAGDLDGASQAGFGYPQVILTGNQGWDICFSQPQTNTYQP